MPKWFTSLTLQCSRWLQNHLALRSSLHLGSAEKCDKTPYILCQFQAFVIQNQWKGFPHFLPLFFNYQQLDDVWGRLNKAKWGKSDGYMASGGNLLVVAEGFTLHELKVFIWQGLFHKDKAFTNRTDWLK